MSPLSLEPGLRTEGKLNDQTKDYTVSFLPKGC